MDIFGKHSEEDYEDDEEFEMEEEREDKKLTRKFKDLDPKNKRKRKEPPKPWGRKERLVVLIILFSTIVISTFLALGGGRIFSLRSSSFSIPKFDFSALNPFKEETIIVNKK